MKIQVIFTSIITFVVILAACGQADPTATSRPSPTRLPTRAPTQTPTPTPDFAKVLAARDHVEAADKLRDQKRFQESLGEYDQAIQLDPESAKAYYGRGTAYLNLGQLERAMQEFDTAIGLVSQYAEAYNNRGVAYLRLGQAEQAIEGAKLGQGQLSQVGTVWGEQGKKETG